MKICEIKLFTINKGNEIGSLSSSWDISTESLMLNKNKISLFLSFFSSLAFFLFFSFLSFSSFVPRRLERDLFGPLDQHQEHAGQDERQLYKKIKRENK